MRAVLIAVGLALVAVGAPVAGSAAQPNMRTVVVVPAGKSPPPGAFTAARDCLGRASTCVNGKDGSELVYAVSGRPVNGAATGLVLTDANCQADQYGISHCLNVIRLAGGGQITVRHDHRMANDPCLAPGERVRVRPL